jgi:hypothetical protein
MDMTNILQQVSYHAGTRRGRQALMAVVENDLETRSQTWSSRRTQESVPARQRWARDELSYSIRYSRESAYQVQVAQTIQQAREEYDLVAQASTLLLLEQDSGEVGGDNN